MKKLYLLLFALLFYLAAIVEGCALFKKTSKTSVTDSQSSAKQVQLSQLVLKSANKETQVFTYWNDSGFYQFQNIKEQVDEAKASKLASREKQEVKRQSTVKTAEPARAWIYAGLAVMVVGGIIVYKRLRHIFN